MPKRVKWIDTADAALWEKIARQLRVADSCTRSVTSNRITEGVSDDGVLDAARVAYRVHTAECSAAVACARELAKWISNADRRQQARKAINASANALRHARGV